MKKFLITAASVMLALSALNVRAEETKPTASPSPSASSQTENDLFKAFPRKAEKDPEPTASGEPEDSIDYGMDSDHNISFRLSIGDVLLETDETGELFLNGMDTGCRLVAGSVESKAESSASPEASEVPEETPEASADAENNAEEKTSQVTLIFVDEDGNEVETDETQMTPGIHHDEIQAPDGYVLAGENTIDVDADSVTKIVLVQKKEGESVHVRYISADGTTVQEQDLTLPDGTYTTIEEEDYDAAHTLTVPEGYDAVYPKQFKVENSSSIEVLVKKKAEASASPESSASPSPSASSRSTAAGTTSSVSRIADF